MQYSPTLKKAMEEIKAVLHKYDIAGHIIIHTPGFSEWVAKLDPSYSAISIQEGKIVIKGNLDHYGGDKDIQLQKLTASVNLLHHFNVTCRQHADIFQELENKVGEHMDIFHSGPGGSDHITQNN